MNAKTRIICAVIAAITLATLALDSLSLLSLSTPAAIVIGIVFVLFSIPLTVFENE
jgi:small-conductance mechanosensitive channel